MKKTKSLLSTLKFWLSVFIIILSTVTISSVYYFLKKKLQQQYYIQKSSTIKQVKESFVYPLWYINKNEIEMISNSFMQNEIIEGIKVVILPYNEVIFDKQKKMYNIEISKIPIKYNSQTIGYVIISFSPHFFYASLNNIIYTNIFLSLLVILIIFIVSDAIIKNLIYIPIKNIQDILHKIGDGQYNVSIKDEEYKEFVDIYEGIRVLANNISNRESRLIESERKFRSVAENIPVGILIYQCNSLTYCNRAAEKILGCNKNEIDKVLIRHIGSTTSSNYLQGKVFEYKGRENVKFVTDKGKIKNLDLIMDKIKFNGDIGYVMVIVDNTEYKRALDEIERLQKLLKNILDSVPSSVFTIDVDYNVTYWNKSFLDTYAKGKNYLKGKNLFDIMDLDDKIKVKLAEAIKTKKEEYIFRTSKDNEGRERYENITISPLVSNGIEGMVIKIDDVTDYIKFNERLVQSDKMITIGNMAAGIAHEINNPLAVIMQAAEVCLNRLEHTLKNDQAASLMKVDFKQVEKYVTEMKIKDLLQKIKLSTNRAAGIIRSLSFFARGKDGELEQVDLRELMENTLTIAYTDYSLKEKYDVKKIKVTKKYGKVPLVKCEPGKLQLVFLNIIKNAAQAMAGMEDPELKIKIDSSDGGVVVEIEDNGSGMDEKVKKHIFDPFFTTREVGQGTGLGLYTAYLIVSQHGGFIDVTSSLGKGTTFKIYLPVS